MATALTSEQVRAAIGPLRDPEIGRSLADLDMLKSVQADGHRATIEVELPTPVYPDRQRIADAGLTDRCQVVSGSFFDAVPRGADAYVLKEVLIDWSDERAAAILKNCRDAMPAHGQVLIVEGQATLAEVVSARREANAARAALVDARAGLARARTLFHLVTGVPP